MPMLQFVAILSTTFFTGAAIYINLVEHPARMQCGTGLAATEFGPSYRRAAAMQATLALIAAFAGFGAWLTGAPRAWFSGAVLIFGVVPFTLLAIMPTNKKLLDPALDRSSEDSTTATTVGPPSRSSQHSWFRRLECFSRLHRLVLRRNRSSNCLAASE